MPTPRGAGVPAAGAAADALRAVGALLALEPGTRFRARAYQRGADVVEALPDLEALNTLGPDDFAAAVRP